MKKVTHKQAAEWLTKYQICQRKIIYVKNQTIIDAGIWKNYTKYINDWFYQLFHKDTIGRTNIMI